MISNILVGFLGLPDWLTIALALLTSAMLLVAVLLAIKYGGLWLQAKMSGTDVSIVSLIGMSLRNVNASQIVNAQVMANQAGLTISQGARSSTSALEAHYLAGGDVNRVVLAIIAANRAGLDLDFDRAAAIDLSGRDLSEAVSTSIFPKVIDCPDPNSSNPSRSLSAVAKNGVELLIQVRVTVRTNLDQLIGGATEETIVARVGQGIVSTVGSMDSHTEALSAPNRISMEVFEKGIESNTAYEIVSIDVASIDVGRNIGARLQTEQAEADTRVARAGAEMRRANAGARLAEMSALVTEKRAEVVRAEASVQSALAQAFRDGQFYLTDGSETAPGSILKFPDSQLRA
ncbi:flotillin-like FloA family protein [Mariniblastus fucicola]|uniref:SigmaW regulon antibacterial n=1 Tax=Mariniblastus fucicola TaxID=980251 RepID=A0A5B9P7A6_9BACT|nr:flotillin-like FloA family protein [Mariniblastus fucicola]QEG21075.1 SigmaW regulon antibacterial [Mariniblastus fucicola]